MAVSKEREEVFRKFMIDRLWPAYPADLAAGRKGSRGEAIKSLIKINPDDDELERIFRNMEAQKAFDRASQKTGEFVPRWPYLVTYLNQRRYDDEIEVSHSELGQHQRADSCIKCGGQTHGPRFDLCTDHLAESLDTGRERRIQALKDAGMFIRPGEARHDYFRRCMEYARGILRRSKGGRTLVSGGTTNDQKDD